MDELERALREHFGFEQFRPYQREVIEHILARRHTLAVLPTGLGKSLCYQLAAQMLDGVTLVISPLIALMQDQVDALLRRGFTTATFLSSALSPTEIGQRYADIERGACKLVYVAPERCDSPRFQQLARAGAFSLVVIDEAHCISQWGHDFRPHYRTLLARLPELRRATFLALTATATPDVQNDIVTALELPAVERIIASFDRPNLHLGAIRIEEREKKNEFVAELLSQDDGAAIVYSSTRKEAVAAFEMLHSRGFDVCLYHAGLDAARRSQAQRRFLQGDCRVMVATVAFGLGIDKPDVRRVIHYNVPGSLENYYQEAGRAGRDGRPAHCTLLYSQSDVRIQRFLTDQAHPEPRVILRIHDLLRDASPLAISAGDLTTASGMQELAVNAALQLLYEQHWAVITAEGRYALAQTAESEPRIDLAALNQRRWRANQRLKAMISYALDLHCRRARVLEYFGQRFSPPCKACDICEEFVAAASAESFDHRPLAAEAGTTNETSDRAARAILQAVAVLSGRFGRTTIADLLSGSRRKKLVEMGLDRSQHHGTLRLHGHDRIVTWIDELLARKLMRTTAEEYPCLQITETGREALRNEMLIALSSFEASGQPPAAEMTQEEASKDDAIEITSNEALIAKLKLWRREQAASQGVPAYVILHDSVVEAIAREQPRMLDQLAAIKGIGSRRLEQFGERLLELIHDASPLPEDWRLRIEIWRQGGAEPEAQTLLQLLRDWRRQDRHDLILLIGALRDLKSGEVATVLPNLLMDLLDETTDGNFLTLCCEALGQLGIAEVAPRAVKLLDDARPAVRRAAVRTLGMLRVRSVLERIEMLASEDQSDYVRIAAQAAAWLIKQSAPREAASAGP